jgi:hypothetical protein
MTYWILKHREMNENIIGNGFDLQRLAFQNQYRNLNYVYRGDRPIVTLSILRD